jgi:hypothetical protein
MFGLLAQAAIKAMVDGITAAAANPQRASEAGAIECPRCHARAWDGAKYCRACGKGLAGREANPATALAACRGRDTLSAGQEVAQGGGDGGGRVEEHVVAGARNP